MNIVLKVAKHEFFRVTKSRTFWVTTLLLPLLILGLPMLSGLSAESAIQSAAAQLDNASRILVVDDVELFSEAQLDSPFVLTDNLDVALADIKADKVDAVFYYPAEVLSGGDITVYEQDQGLFSEDPYSGAAQTLLQDTLLNTLPVQQASLLKEDLGVSTVSYKGGGAAPGLESYIIPLSFVALFFLLLYVSLNYLITAISEEKENRVLEIMLTTMKPFELVMGKIIGLTGAAVTQGALFVALVGAAVLSVQGQLPWLSLADLTVSPAQVFFGLAYLVLGFLIYAAMLFSVSAATATAREAGMGSGVLLLLAISPLYFISNLLQSPNGWVAQMTSYLPFTAPSVLLLRNATHTLSFSQGLAGLVVLNLYVLLGFVLAIRLLNKTYSETNNSSTQTRKRVSLKHFMTLKRHSA